MGCSCQNKTIPRYICRLGIYFVSEFSIPYASYKKHKSFARVGKSIQFEFKSIDIDLKIETNPTDALVFIDGKQIGSTPFNGMVSAGQKKLEIHKEGFQPYFETLELYEEGQKKKN